MTNYYNAHEVKKGDPRINGPYLDDIRAQEEEMRRQARRANSGGKHKNVEVEEDGDEASE